MNFLSKRYEAEMTNLMRSLSHKIYQDVALKLEASFKVIQDESRKQLDSKLDAWDAEVDKIIADKVDKVIKERLAAFK
jgi:glutamyl-tRNA reductase